MQEANNGYLEVQEANNGYLEVQEASRKVQEESNGCLGAGGKQWVSGGAGDK